jgi:hypothetical protein
LIVAGYSRIYCIGEHGGFLGVHGLNPIWFQLWVGDADRQWWEAHYFDDNFEPLGNISVMVPARPDDPDALLDACIAFAPRLFASCATLATVAEQAVGLERLDFDLEPKRIPDAWKPLRAEAREVFNRLSIFEATLRQLQ